jgi:hypothetical protein
MVNTFKSYAHKDGGRALLLFLLFALALWQFYTAGFSAFAMVCVAPFAILFVYAAFTYRMFTFWLLFVVNYFLQWHSLSLPFPTSLPNEMLELLLLAIAIVDARQTPHFERAVTPMLLALAIWCGFCTLEVLNDSCNLGINIGTWYTGARLLAFQLMYIYLVFCIYITSPQIVMNYLKLWGALALFSAIWTWKQQNIGFTDAEYSWLHTRGASTHIIQAGTLTRYFSTFSDAANYGCNAAATGVAFIIFGITTKQRRDKFFFLIVALMVIVNMFASGTRTAIFCLFGGFAVYIVLSKSFKIAVPAAIVGAFFMFLLVFTTIGQGNQQIRRMRSAFDKGDASVNVRDINKATIRKYINDTPWGIGIGMGNNNVPANNKFHLMANIAPDSEYVFIWIRTGDVGLTVFVLTMLLMLGGACYTVLFRLKNPTLIGIGAGFCCAFVAIQLGGYANQVLLQYPNGLLFYGGLTIVYLLPHLEPAWIEYENKRLAEQEERRRLRLEKKKASRV